MPETYGAQECRVYFVQESTYGVTPTNPSMLGVNSEGPEPKIDPGLIKLYGTGTRDYQALYAGMRKVGLKIPVVISSLSPISFIQHVQTLNSLSVQVVYYKGLWASPSSIISFLHTGCKLNKVSLECHVEDVIKGNVELIGQNVTRGTALITGASYGDYVGGVPFNSSFVQKGAAGGGSYVALTTVTDWKWDVENNLKEVPVIQSDATGLLKYLRERNRKLGGELTLEFESDAELADLLSDTEFSLLFGLGSTNTALFKYCKWEDYNPTTKVEALVSAKAKFTARDLFIS